MRIFIGGGRKLSFVDTPDQWIGFAHQAVEIGDGAGEAFAELDFGLPTQVLARFFDVRLTLLRIVARQKTSFEPEPVRSAGASMKAREASIKSST